MSRLRIFALLITLLIGAVGMYFFLKYQEQSRAAAENVIDLNTLSQDSGYAEQSGTVSFDLYTDATENNTVATSGEPALFETKAKNDAGVVEFITKNPQVNVTELEDKIKTSDSVKGVAVKAGNERKPILPPNFEGKLIRRFKDDNIHHYYEQEVQNIPVYGSMLAVHMKENAVYALSGGIVNSQTLPAASLSVYDAERIAMAEAKKRAPELSLTISQSEKSVFNAQLIGLSSDGRNYLTQAVTVVASNDTNPFAYRFFVDLSDGSLRYAYSLIRDALNRSMTDCSSGTTCAASRTEGQEPVANTDVNSAYDYLGDTYNLFMSLFQRDSYDGSGAGLRANTNILATMWDKCPNAAWNGEKQAMYICKSMAVKDVMAHEMTHAVTERTARLLYNNQSGALNESISDIFGWGVDDANWTMGEGSQVGVIRRLDDPTKSPTKAQPDKLFSSNYYCQSLDNGGVHINSGVMNKAFYLMVTGGSFNGCTIPALGKDKSLSIMYKALTTYLRSTSNFKSAYTAILQACSDLYDATTCDGVKAALQSVEMDQQPDSSSTSPVCQRVQAQTPQCAGGQPQPTSPPGATATIRPTTPANNPTNTVAPTAPSGASPTPPASGTLTPSPTKTPTPTPSPTPNVTLSLKLRFQGIQSAPPGVKQVVQVTAVSNSGNRVVGKGEVLASGAIWIGDIPLSLPGAGEYRLYVKGPKHIQKRICVVSPEETLPGSYRCQDDRSLTLKLGKNEFDWSKITLMSGDVPPQDGVINSADLSYIKNNLGSRDVSIVEKADINLDGVVDAQDYSLVVASLAIKYDE